MEYGHLRQQAKDFIIPNEVTHTSSTRMAYLLIKTDSVARVLVYSITNRRRQVEVNGVLNWNRVPPEHHGFLPAEIGFLFL